jgi:hypothetical protein
MSREPFKWYDPSADNRPWIRALAVRHMAAREGYCFHHEQAIIVSIDQYAEAALDNRDYFLNRPYGIGGRSDNIP